MKSKNTFNESTQNPNISKCMGYNERGVQREIYSYKCIHLKKEEENFRIDNNLTSDGTRERRAK